MANLIQTNNANIKIFGGKLSTDATSSEGGDNEPQNALQFEGQNLQYNGETLTFTLN